MKSKHIQTIIIMISCMFINGCVGYPQQPYQHYSAPNYGPSYGGYNYTGNYGGYAAAPRPYTQPAREYRDYGNYRSHENNRGNHEESREGRRVEGR